MTILDTNWTLGKNEIDIIARHESTLVFIEVKTRDVFFCDLYRPESAVDHKKQATLRRLGEIYWRKYQNRLSYHGIRKRQFDIVTVIVTKKYRLSAKKYQITHFPDAF